MINEISHEHFKPQIKVSLNKISCFINFAWGIHDLYQTDVVKKGIIFLRKKLLEDITIFN
jgi:hypothetical protein